MKKHLFTLIALLITVCSLFAEEKQTILTETLTVFGNEGTPPVYLDSSRDWTIIAVIDWNSIDNRTVVKKSARLWRLRSRYEHQGPGGPATVQIRIRNQAGKSIFTHPWTQNAQRTAEAYSNWFEDPGRQVDSGSRSIVEAKLIASPRVALQGKLYSVSMEAWDVVPDTTPPNQTGPSVQLAYTQPLSVNLLNPQTPPHGNGPEAALEFALEFIDYCLTGDLASYYRSHAKTVYSLSDGNPYQKYSNAPPSQIPGISTIDEYKLRFDYKLYAMDVYEDLFPEWFEATRKWKPSTGTYLFMGHIDRMEKADLDDVNYLIFCVDMRNDGEWQVIARP